MQLYGHRGARKEAPENTLIGFEHLRSLNIHRVELDIRLSRDDRLVVLHDDTLDRTTDYQGKVRNVDSTELQSINAAAEHNGHFAFTPVPLFEDVLDAWPDLKHIQIEVKPTRKPDLVIIADALQELMTSRQLHDCAVVTSKDRFFLSHMQSHYPDIERGFVAEYYARKPIDIALNLGCRFLCANHIICTKRLIKRAHEAGLHLSTWTVNDIKRAQQLKAAGIDSLISDVPSDMLELAIR